VVLPDRDTMAHAVLPGMEAVERGDNEGAKNLLGIGIQVSKSRCCSESAHRVDGVASQGSGASSGDELL
jgi:hypothetical protein